MNDFILAFEVRREESAQFNNHNWEKYYSQERKSILREKLIFLSVCDGKEKKSSEKYIMLLELANNSFIQCVRDRDLSDADTPLSPSFRYPLLIWKHFGSAQILRAAWILWGHCLEIVPLFFHLDQTTSFLLCSLTLSIFNNA